MDMHAAVLHGIGQTPRYELFTAPVAGEADALADAGAAFDSLALPGRGGRDHPRRQARAAR